MYQQRWLYLTIAAVIGILIILLTYQTFTQTVFPWDLLALVTAVSMACLALLVLGGNAFTPYDRTNGREVANRVVTLLVLTHFIGMAVLIAYDSWFQDEMRWPFYIGYGIPVYVLGFFLMLGKYRASGHKH